MYVVDASVAVKWFSEEEFTEKAIEIRDNFFKGKYELAAPDLILYEVSNALRFNQNFNEEDVVEAVNSLFDMEISIIVPTPRVIKSSITMAFKYKITVYDAFYPALAGEIGFAFVTADSKLYQKIKDLEFVKHISEF
ncbi:MAG TPA: type II toxin-antitoxin system VapC family toxin [Candidatus Methanoperedens sp.]